MNDFHKDLEYSLEASGSNRYDKFYFDTFPTLDKIEEVTDLELQKKGIDKILTFHNRKTVFIDEKKRRKDYGDILLEEYSNYERKTIGWLGRKKVTDYIVYIIEPSNKIYLLPFLLLQLCWIDNYHNWVKLYGRRFAPNNGYTTSNIPIPTAVLLNTIKDKMKFKINYGR